MRYGPWLLLTALLAGTASASTGPAAPAHMERAITRLDDIRAALHQFQQGAQTPPSKSGENSQLKLAQWLNWGNWPNWNNWSNWGNWGNWFNG